MTDYPPLSNGAACQSSQACPPVSEGILARGCRWRNAQLWVAFVGKMLRGWSQPMQGAANFSMLELLLRLTFFEKSALIIVYTRAPKEPLTFFSRDENSFSDNISHSIRAGLRGAPNGMFIKYPRGCFLKAVGIVSSFACSAFENLPCSLLF